MRLWLSLTAFLPFVLLICDAKQTMYYPSCDDDQVCLIYANDACDVNGQRQSRKYGVYLWVNGSSCEHHSFGKNYAGLRIRPIPPYVWEIQVQVRLERAPTNSRILNTEFRFEKFTLSFPNEGEVRLTWTDGRSKHLYHSKQLIFFMERKSQIEGNGRKYNTFEFAIELKNEKLLDLVVNSEVTYYYSKDKSDANVQSAKMVDPGFRKRLEQLDGCNIEQYFDKNNCHADALCTTAISAYFVNRKVKRAENICKIGKLQYNSNGSWHAADKLYCRIKSLVTDRRDGPNLPTLQWTFDEGRRANEDIAQLDYARCILDETCAVNFAERPKNCFLPADCKAVNLTGNSLSCQAGYDLEVALEEKWRYSVDTRCYDKWLIQLDKSGKYIDTAANIRCRKQRKCDLLNFYKISKCANYEFCEKPSDTSYTCNDGYQLQYQNEGSFAWNEIDKLECKEKQLRLVIDNQPSDIVPLRVRCMKKKRCVLANYAPPDNVCGVGNECELPSLNNDNELKCRPEFGLQVNYRTVTLVWTPATAIYCIRDNYFADIDGIEFFPLHIRCIRKNIDHFYEKNDCQDHEMCKKPENCDSLTCGGPLWNLQMKSPTTSNLWVDVKSVTCNSDNFLMNNGLTADPSSKFRCVLYKCTSCENPCPGCVSDSAFEASAKWDKCVKFNCGPNTRTYYGVGENITKSQNVHFECSNGTSFWKLNGSSEAKNLKIQCEKLCWLQSPLKSTCPPNSESCKEHDSVDFTQLSCGIFMYADIGNDERLHIKQLECDKQDGLWKAKNVDGNIDVIIPEGSNVYCYEGKCELSRIFPSCESDDNECADYDIEDHRYTCKEPYTFWERYRSDEEWKEMKGVSELQCLAGSIVANGKRKDYDLQANCRKKVPKTTAKSNLGAYLVVMVLVLLLTVVVIATIILRISGNGWLHTLVIEMIRNKNKKRARSHSSAPSLPRSNHSQTPMSNSSSKKTQKGSPSSKSKSSSKKMRKTTGRANSVLSSVPASSKAASKMNSLANEPKKVFVI